MQSILIRASTISSQHCAQETAQTVIHKIGILSVLPVQHVCWGKSQLPKLHCHLLVTMLQCYMVCCCTMIGVDCPASLPLNACHSWCEHVSVAWHATHCGPGYQVHMEVLSCTLGNKPYLIHALIKRWYANTAYASNLYAKAWWSFCSSGHYTHCAVATHRSQFCTGYDDRAWCKSVHFVLCQAPMNCHCSSSTSLTSSTADWKTGLLKVVFAPSSEASLTIEAVLLSPACSCPPWTTTLP